MARIDSVLGHVLCRRLDSAEIFSESCTAGIYSPDFIRTAYISNFSDDVNSSNIRSNNNYQTSSQIFRQIS